VPRTTSSVHTLDSDVARIFVEQRARARARRALGLFDLSLADISRRDGILDDYFSCAAGVLNSIANARLMLGILRRWRLPRHERKLTTEGVPSPEAPVLGYGVATEPGTLFVTEEKVAACMADLDALEACGPHAPYELVHSAAMRLLWCARAVARGPFKLQGFFLALRGASTGSSVRITPAMRRNMRWFRAFFLGEGSKPWNGVSYFPSAEPLVHGVPGSDASDWGFGLHFRGRFVYGPGLEDEAALHVSVREASALLIFVVVFGDDLRGEQVSLGHVVSPDQDNEGVHFSFTNQSAGSEQLYAVLDLVDLAAARQSVHLSMRLVKSAENTLADLPSRNRIPDFLAHFFAISPAGTPPPKEEPLPAGLRPLWRKRLCL